MLKKIEWFGTVTNIAGAFLVAFGFLIIGYSFFMVASAAWLFVGYKQQNYPLITLNGTFFIANIIGFARAVL